MLRRIATRDELRAAKREVAKRVWDAVSAARTAAHTRNLAAQAVKDAFALKLSADDLAEACQALWLENAESEDNVRLLNKIAREQN